MKRFLTFGLLRPLILGWAFAMLILPVEIDGYLINAPKALFLAIASPGIFSGSDWSG